MASTEVVTAALAQSTLSEVGDPAAKAKKGSKQKPSKATTGEEDGHAK
jgi:hypothetical protein